MTTARLATTVLTADEIEHRVPAPESLRPWITEVGHLPMGSAGSGLLAHAPQAVTTIMLRRQLSGRRDALVVGPRTHATYARSDKTAGCVRLRLAPGAAHPMLGIPARDLTDRVFRLADIPGPLAELADPLSRVGPGEVVPFLEDTLPQRLREDPTHRAHRRLLGDAVAAMSTGCVVRDLAASLAVSERQLRKLFSTGIGVSPKYFARIGRVRQVIAAAGNTSWSRVASATGYYDQSHMTADFRALMGIPPTAFFRGQMPPPTPCQSLTAP